MAALTRLCAAPGCGKALVQRKGEAGSDFRKRLTCGPSCGSKIPRDRGPKRYAGVHGVCRFCGGRARVKSNGEPMVSCANPACRKKAYQGAHLMDNLPWPQRTGEIAADFRSHNIIPADVYGSLPARPATLVGSRSSIA